MAIERIYGGLWIPQAPPFNTLVPSFTSMLMAVSTDMVAFILQIPRTGTLDKFEFRLGASTQLPTNGLRCSFQEVDTPTGDPAGIDDQFRVVTGLSVNSWIVPGLITDDGTDSGVKRPVNRGEFLACVISFESFNALDVVNVSAIDLSSTAFVGSPVYSDHFTGVSWAKETNGPTVVLKYDDGTYESALGCYPVKDLYATAYNTASSPSARGMTFSFPTDILLGGIYARIACPVGADLLSCIVTLYENYSVIDLVEVFDEMQATPNAHFHILRFSQDRLLRANVAYRIMVEPFGLTNVTLYEFDTASVDIMLATEGGQNFYLSTLVGSEIVYDTTRRPWMGLIVTGIEHEISGDSGGPGFEGVP